MCRRAAQRTLVVEGGSDIGDRGRPHRLDVRVDPRRAQARANRAQELVQLAFQGVVDRVQEARELAGTRRPVDGTQRPTVQRFQQQQSRPPPAPPTPPPCNFQPNARRNPAPLQRNPRPRPNPAHPRKRTRRFAATGRLATTASARAPQCGRRRPLAVRSWRREMGTPPPPATPQQSRATDDC